MKETQNQKGKKILSRTGHQGINKMEARFFWTLKKKKIKMLHRVVNRVIWSKRWRDQRLREQMRPYFKNEMDQLTEEQNSELVTQTQSFNWKSKFVCERWTKPNFFETP